MGTETAERPKHANAGRRLATTVHLRRPDNGDVVTFYAGETVGEAWALDLIGEHAWEAKGRARRPGSTDGDIESVRAYVEAAETPEARKDRAEEMREEEYRREGGPRKELDRWLTREAAAIVPR